MKKWYRSAPCKGILLALEHILAMVMAVCLAWTVCLLGSGFHSAALEKPKKLYSDTKEFEDCLQNMATRVVWAEEWTPMFQKDGKIDEDKIVDIQEYYDNGKISGENKSGLAYRLGDILDWESVEGYGGYEADSEGSESKKKPIIVCEKPDGTYDYYYSGEFRRKVAAEELVFGNAAIAKENYGLKTPAEIVDGLVERTYVGEDSIFKNILDKEGNLAYNSCWMYDDWSLIEEFAPIGAENILEIVNENPEWNGKLSEAMEQISTTLNSIQTSVNEWKQARSEWKEGDTNAAYLIVNLKTNHIDSNRAEYQNADWKASLEKMKKLGRYVIVTPSLKDFESNMEDASAPEWRSLIDANLNGNDYICAFAVDTEYPIQDYFYQGNQAYVKYAPIARSVLIGGVLAGIGVLAGLVWLTVIAGRSNERDGVVLLWIDRIKTEIFLGVSAGLFFLACIVGITACKTVFRTDYYGGEYSAMAVRQVSAGLPELLLIAGAACLLCATGLFLWLGLVRRLTARTIWKNSVLRWLCGFVGNLFRHIGLLWKTILVFGVFVVIHWIAIEMNYTGEWILIALAAEAAAFIYLIRSVLGKERIKKGVQAIADGQVDYQIPLEKLNAEQREVAESVNKIGDGLERALEESMKNERLKTDLITNVSHDIKTPLTSIINYVELLKRENFEDPKIQNYIKVLEEKAYRLKTLTEDVVEASKVSSGNIKLEKMNLNLVELVNQTSGEFEEKLEARNLNLIVKMPEEPVVIYADGRRMWRVLANIFNNAAKYAMDGSRVYVDLVQTDREVVFTMKNVSAQPLNISADELTERFIRGDVSRSTEGSGLGLSIAQNLTRLQGGEFELYLDGDLFKVQIRFPRIK